MEKITEVTPPPFTSWGITHHVHEEVDDNGDTKCRWYELERDSQEKPWKCPSCGKTVVDIFSSID